MFPCRTAQVLSRPELHAHGLERYYPLQALCLCLHLHGLKLMLTPIDGFHACRPAAKG